MKVVQVCPSYPPYVGGVGTHVENLSRELANRGLEVEIYTLDPKGTCDKLQVSDSVVVRRFRGSYFQGPYSFSRDLLESLKDASADIVHAHDFKTIIPLTAAIAKKTNKIKLALTMYYHGTGHTFLWNILFQTYRRVFGKPILKSSDLTICTSKYEEELVLKHFKKISNLQIIPCCINEELYSRTQRSKEETRFKILFVGRLEAYKGVQFLLRGFHMLLADLDAELWIVGNGPFKDYLTSLSRKLKIADKVTFSDKVGSEVLSEYLSADLVVVPSLLESFNLVAIEALACGTPVLTTPLGEATVLAKKGWCLEISNPKDIRELYEKMKRILTGSITFDLHSIRSQILENYSSERIADITLAAYERILA